MILTKQEVETLTGRQRFTAQCRALRSMGIAYAIRLDGSPVVLRAAVDAALGSATITPREPELRL